MENNKEFNDFMSELVQKMTELKEKFNGLSSANKAKVVDVCRYALALHGVNVTAEEIIKGINTNQL